MSRPSIDVMLREAAEATLAAAQRRARERPTVDELLEGQARRRRLRMISAGVVGLATAAMLTVVLVARPPTRPTPEILSEPTSTRSPDAEDEEQTSDDAASRSGRWLEGKAGDSIELNAAILESLIPATGDPVVVPWGPDVVGTVAAATGSHTYPDGTEMTLVHLQGSVDRLGNVLIAPTNDRGDLILAEPQQGTSRLLDVTLRAVRSVAAMPAGGWLVSAVDTDDQAAVLRISPDGTVASRATLTPSPPRGGGILEVVGSTVWLVNSFESVDLDRGAQATLVSDDGGQTLMSHVSWRPATQVVPDREFVDYSTDGNARSLASVPMRDGRVAIEWVGEPVEGALSLFPVDLTGNRPVLGTSATRISGSVERLQLNTVGPAPHPHGDVLIAVADGSAHVGRVGPGQTTDRPGTMLSPSPDGQLWHLTFDADKLTIRKILLPVSARW